MVWACLACTYNNADGDACAVCNTARPKPTVINDEVFDLTDDTSTSPNSEVQFRTFRQFAPFLFAQVCFFKEEEEETNTEELVVACPKCEQPYVHVVSSRVPLQTGRDPMSPSAWKHFCRYRLRCRKPECGVDFCVKCNESPYHRGRECGEKDRGSCRFCEIPLNNPAPPYRSDGTAHFLDECCTDEECLEKRDRSCDKRLKCGCPCSGLRNEMFCMQCLHCDKGSVDGNDYCKICMCEGLRNAPCVELECGCVFHEHCIRAKVTVDATSPDGRILVSHLRCPACQALPLRHVALDDVLEEPTRLFELVRHKALARLESEGMHNDPVLTDKGEHFYDRPLDYALHSLAFYKCYKCEKPFFGGRRDCAAEINATDEKRDPEEFVCFSCSDLRLPGACQNEDHADFHLYKCRFCCNHAVWFCWGTHHFCDKCHSKAGRYYRHPPDPPIPCLGVGKCASGGDHNGNGKEMFLRCGKCQEDHDILRKQRELESAGEQAALESLGATQSSTGSLFASLDFDDDLFQDMSASKEKRPGSKQSGPASKRRKTSGGSKSKNEHSRSKHRLGVDNVSIGSNLATLGVDDPDDLDLDLDI